MDIPDELLGHTITFEAYAGGGAYGDTWSAPVNLACFVSDKRRLIRAANGSQVVAESTVITRLDALTAAPARSRITFADGRTTLLLKASRHDGSGLPTPDHWELLCE